ncbi:hypothetical protein RMCBS344292_13616 [Rhizopus microsporus]|uniref:arginine--tRNA ligase n=1 Tax=Rhizopus microsporus TaxID=58291 RepID=A0A0A1P640_RHIZD|nr:arginyl-tRNA synthetase [Rhizopus microsporus]CEI99529.1 hypothetical protein RMCBS344292_13616 [Rhizopus microsporus]
MLKFKQIVAEQLSRQTSVQPAKILQSLVIPNKKKQGDLSISIFDVDPQLRTLKPDPQLISTRAQSIVNQFEPNQFIEQAIVEAPKIAFKFNSTEFTKEVLNQVFNEGTSYGWAHNPKTNKTVVLDYSSPNIAKKFHVGHLRSTILGNYVKRIHEAFGYKVIGINYLGDWGKQYGLLAVGYEKYGDEAQLNKDPIRHLYDIYVKINADAKDDPDVDVQANQYFKRMEEGDPQALAQWKRFRDLSIQSYEALYKRLDVTFDVYAGESEAKDYISKVYNLLEQKNLITETPDGAQLVDLTPYGLDKTPVRRADGTSLYLTRDLATLLRRKEKYNFDKAIYVVGKDQEYYFKQVFQTANLMLPEPVELQHVSFGHVKGMSTRRGEVVFLEDLLNEAQRRNVEYMQNSENCKVDDAELDYTADILGTSAIMIQDMKTKRALGYDFSWDKMLNPDGKTGVRIQFAHAKACGIERRAGVPISLDCDFTLLKEEVALHLVHMIAQFPEIVDQSFKRLEPSIITSYLFDLMTATNGAYKWLQVIRQSPEVSRVRMLLFWSARTTLRNGMYLLGINRILEKM